MLRSCGTQPMPARARWSGRRRGDVAPVERDGAGAATRDADDGVEQRGLAGAVAAEQRQRLALRQREVDAEERGPRRSRRVAGAAGAQPRSSFPAFLPRRRAASPFHLALAEIDGAHGGVGGDLGGRALGEQRAVDQHRDAVWRRRRRGPCRARSAARRRRAAARRPCRGVRAALPPARRRPARRAAARAVGWRRRRRSRAAAACRRAGSRARCSMTSASRKRSSDRDRLVDDRAAGARAPPEFRAFGMGFRQSEADRLQRREVGEELVDLEGARQAARARLRRASRLMSRPSSRTWPEVGGSTPVSRLTKVVLPAPFGPIRACRAPTGSEKVTSLVATRPPKRRTRFFGGEHRTGSRLGSCRAALPAMRCRMPVIDPSRRRAEQHDQHEDEADPEVPVLRRDGGELTSCSALKTIAPMSPP